MILGRPSGRARMPDGDDRGAAAAANADHAGDVVSRLDKAGEGDAHGGDRGAAVIAAEHGAAAAGVMAGDLVRRDVRPATVGSRVPTSTRQRRRPQRRSHRPGRRVPRPWCRRCPPHRCASLRSPISGALDAAPAAHCPAVRRCEGHCKFLRRAYRIDMNVSRQQSTASDDAERGRPARSAGRARARNG